MGVPNHLFAALDSEVEAQSDRVPGTAAQRRALERIRNGTFGLCVECDRPIEPARLDHSPLTEACWQCARLEALGRT